MLMFMLLMPMLPIWLMDLLLCTHLMDGFGFADLWFGFANHGLVFADLWFGFANHGFGFADHLIDGSTTHANALAARTVRPSRPGCGASDLRHSNCGDSDPRRPDDCCYAPKLLWSCSAHIAKDRSTAREWLHIIIKCQTLSFVMFHSEG